VEKPRLRQRTRGKGKEVPEAAVERKRDVEPIDGEATTNLIESPQSGVRK